MLAAGSTGRAERDLELATWDPYGSSHDQVVIHCRCSNQSQQLSRQPQPVHLKWACSGNRSPPHNGHSGYVPSGDRQVCGLSVAGITDAS